MFSFCMKTNFIIFTLLQLRDTRAVNCVRNTAWRRRKQTQNCAAVPCLSTRAVVIKHLSHRNLSCPFLRGLRCLRLNVRPALSASCKRRTCACWTLAWDRLRNELLRLTQGMPLLITQLTPALKCRESLCLPPSMHVSSINEV